jgi:cytochrome c peroxidase
VLRRVVYPAYPPAMKTWVFRWLRATLIAAAFPGVVLAQTFTGPMSGSWWNPGRSGEGQLITFEAVGDRHVAFLSYFTYTPAGEPSWLVGNADYRPGDASVSIPLLTGSGARFGAAFRAGDVATAPAGTAVLEYVSCSQMRLHYSGAESFTVDLVRLIGPLDGVACPQPALPARTASNTFLGTMSGSWWNPQRPGEGQIITFETAGERKVVFLTYFTYTPDGKATWLAGNVDYRPGTASLSIPVIRASGPRFGTAYRAADVKIATAGHVVLDYLSCTEMRMRYVGSESFTVDLTRLIGPIDGASCPSVPAQPVSSIDTQLRPLLAAAGVTGNAARSRVLPSITDPLPQLGKLLFFSKTLSGRLDTACASCHHPSLAGADGLSLSVGAGAESPELVGRGRRLARGGFSVGRNSNTVFNIGLFDHGLFWDSRIESIGKTALGNGAGSGIRTPDTAIGVADARAGATLPAAQARFPVADAAEMRGDAYPGMSASEYRDRLAARLGNYGAGAGELPPSQWLAKFRAAFGSNGTAEQLITFDNIALALAEYQRSATFVDSPWSRYARGDNSAVTDQVKQGALVFFSTTAQGGAQCAQCHRGDFFTDERHHVVGFPQIGAGMGDGVGGRDDFGRERQTLASSDRYRHRTPSLLNVELTAPYGHAGAYADLATVFGHYVVPDVTVADFLRLASWCRLPQFIALADCAGAAADVSRNSLAALQQVDAVRAAAPNDSLPSVDFFRVTQASINPLVAFLNSLTDPCLKDRTCFGRWTPAPSESPDGHQLNAVDANGAPL